ncbi:MAG: LysR family transcriptional regulator [Sphingobium sp.]
MTSLSLRQLDIFAQMVASGSIARCARDAGLPREEVERDLASLELRLGYRLFDQHGDETRLTPAGRRTAQALTLLSRGDSDMWDADASPPATPTPAPEPMPAATTVTAMSCTRAPIVLAAPAPVFGHLQEALTAFEDANEDIAITVDLRVHLVEDAIGAFARGAADIAYFYAMDTPRGIESRYAWSEQLNLYASEGHPLARADTVSHDQIVRTPMLSMEPRNGLRRISEDALSRAGLSGDRPLIETDNMFTILTALRDGSGLFPAFGPLARDLGRMPGIRRIALNMPLPAIEVRQAVRPDARGGMAVEALADYLFL